MNTDGRHERAAARLDLRRLSHHRPSPVTWRASGAVLSDLAARLGLLSVAALELHGEICPEGDEGFRLEARMRARVTQACLATLDPVAATVEADILRRYIAGIVTPEGGEHEIPDDDSIEPLRDRIDLAEIAGEALSLALPDYPRAAPLAGELPIEEAEDKSLPAPPDEAAEPPRTNRPFADLADRLAPSGRTPPSRRKE